eukprot:TRINITY_DN12425_c0_g1_i1.p1 TRINITY_DN12425_c0_g1~~TRINITY_DN12425_c0_g1_i1.p1  ORF type:complete len:364 (+),score=38.43 TRINITY_DN12425_c0_g1_i1:67-1158(+)
MLPGLVPFREALSPPNSPKRPPPRPFLALTEDEEQLATKVFYSSNGITTPLRLSGLLHPLVGSEVNEGEAQRLGTLVGHRWEHRNGRPCCLSLEHFLAILRHLKSRFAEMESARLETDPTLCAFGALASNSDVSSVSPNAALAAPDTAAPQSQVSLDTLQRVCASFDLTVDVASILPEQARERNATSVDVKEFSALFEESPPNSPRRSSLLPGTALRQRGRQGSKMQLAMMRRKVSTASTTGPPTPSSPFPAWALEELEEWEPDAAALGERMGEILQDHRNRKRNLAVRSQGLMQVSPASEHHWYQFTSDGRAYCHKFGTETPFWITRFLKETSPFSKKDKDRSAGNFAGPKPRQRKLAYLRT